MQKLNHTKKDVFIIYLQNKTRKLRLSSRVDTISEIL